MMRRDISTKRFGTVSAGADQIIRMEKPVLGFEKCVEFVIVNSPDTHPFTWLQSTTEPELAFLMVNPKLFYPDYRIEINPREVEDIGLTDSSHVEIYGIVTIGSSVEESTVNLQGPLVVNTQTRQAKQLVLAKSDYSVSAPLYMRVAASDDQVGTTTRSRESSGV